MAYRGGFDADLSAPSDTHVADVAARWRDEGGVRLSDRLLPHCYPYEREAGYLAWAFNNVYLDLGLIINHLGARAEAFVARTLEMAPFRKILYYSDAFGSVELRYLASQLWRNGIRAVLSGFVECDEWSGADAIRVVDLVGCDNAAQPYRLGRDS